MVVVRVGAKYPIMSLRSRSCHRGVESAAIYTGKTKKRNKMWRLAAIRPTLRKSAQIELHTRLTSYVVCFYEVKAIFRQHRQKPRLLEPRWGSRQLPCWGSERASQ